MRKYIIERTLPGAAQMDPSALAGMSNKVLHELGPDIQWVQSFVTDDRITCIYLAENDELIREHARLGGFPIDSVNLVQTIIDPSTAAAAP